MKWIRRMYWIAAAVMLAAGFPYEGTGEFITTLSYYFFFGIIFLYAVPKVLGFGRSARGGRYRVGGLRNTVIGGLEQSTSRAVTGFMMGNGSPAGQKASRHTARAEKKEADRRIRERYKAMNEAIYHENQARKNAGNYSGYQAHNRALAAMNRAKNL